MTPYRRLAAVGTVHENVRGTRLGMTPRAGITVQTHHIAMVMAEQGFGPAIIDSFTAQASGGGLHIRSLLPEVPV